MTVYDLQDAVEELKVKNTVKLRWRSYEYEFTRVRASSPVTGQYLLCKYKNHKNRMCTVLAKAYEEIDKKVKVSLLSGGDEVWVNKHDIFGKMNPYPGPKNLVG